MIIRCAIGWNCLIHILTHACISTYVRNDPGRLTTAKAKPLAAAQCCETAAQGGVSCRSRNTFPTMLHAAKASILQRQSATRLEHMLLYHLPAHIDGDYPCGEQTLNIDSHRRLIHTIHNILFLGTSSHIAILVSSPITTSAVGIH